MTRTPEWEAPPPFTSGGAHQTEDLHHAVMTPAMQRRPHQNGKPPPFTSGSAHQTEDLHHAVLHHAVMTWWIVRNRW
eukprot:358280-Chlamydomonas_euryale.AAC.6